jgi:hypothetical protein
MNLPSSPSCCPGCGRSRRRRAPFKLLADKADRWASVVSERYEKAGAPFEGIMLDYAVDVFRGADRTAKSLVNQDLHGGNVLRAARELWLVVDRNRSSGSARQTASHCCATQPLTAVWDWCAAGSKP